MSDSEENWRNLLYEACYIRDKRIKELEGGLLDAIESYAEYSQYAGEYLCKKHMVEEHIQELRALLGGGE